MITARDIINGNKMKTRFFKWLVRKLAVIPLIHGDPSRLIIDPSVEPSNTIFNLAGGNITVFKGVIFGHNVMLLTGEHNLIGHAEEGRDIIIDEGARIYSGARIIGPCVIGPYAVVAAGAVVRQNVPAWTLVSGNPATIIHRKEEMLLNKHSGETAWDDYHGGISG